MNVFISSVIRNFEEFRTAARTAIEMPGHTVSRAEDWAASPSAPQVACLREAREADVVVLIMGAEYGEPQASGISATYEEYRAVRDDDKVLVFVQQGVDRDSRQETFLSEVQGWEHGHFTAVFRTAEELQAAVARALRKFEVERATGTVDEDDLLSRAQHAADEETKRPGSWLMMTVAPGPRQTLIRPAQLRPDVLGRTIAQALLFGDSALFDIEGLLRPRLVGDHLVIDHKEGWLTLGEDGTLAIGQPAQSPEGLLRPIIEEQVCAKLERALRFSGDVLRLIDETEKATAVLCVATLTNPSTWVTEAEHRANPNRMQMSRLVDWSPLSVRLHPAVRRRSALTADSSQIAEDLTALFRREIKTSGFPKR